MRKIVKEKQENRRTIYSGKILDLYVDQVSIPDGSMHIREIVGHSPAVAIVPIINNNEVLLVRQFRYAVNEVCWEIPAGLINKKESPLNAAKRECLEETGYFVKKIKSLGWIYSSPGFSQEKIYLYLVTELQNSGKQSLDEDEFLVVKKVGIKECQRMIARGLIKDGKTILGLLLAFNQLMLTN